MRESALAAWEAVFYADVPQDAIRPAAEAMEAAIRAALDKLGLREERMDARPEHQGEAWIPEVRLVSDWRSVDEEPSASVRVDTEPSDPDDDLEQAWRNGWGSALNALRACNSIATSAHGATHPEERRILSDLVTGWVASIESLTDNFVAAGREVGFASRAHLEGPSATSEGASTPRPTVEQKALAGDELRAEIRREATATSEGER